MKLYYMIGACSLGPHIALNWINKPYELQRMNHKTIKEPEYLKLNPQGAVPCLVDGDFVLTQNIAIFEYLNELYPEALLLGSDDIYTQAKVRRWLSFCNADLHPKFGLIYGAAKYFEDEASQNKLKETAEAMIIKMLLQVNDALKDKEYLAGVKSAADLYLFVMLRWVDSLGIVVPEKDGIDAFKVRMFADPAVQAAIQKEESK